MKKLKLAIATFICQGKDSWDKLDETEHFYLTDISRKETYSKLLPKSFTLFIDKNGDTRETWVNEIKKLMPYFFEERL